MKLLCCRCLKTPFSRLLEIIAVVRLLSDRCRSLDITFWLSAQSRLLRRLAQPVGAPRSTTTISAHPQAGCASVLQSWRSAQHAVLKWNVPYFERGIFFSIEYSAVLASMACDQNWEGRQILALNMLHVVAADRRDYP